MTQLKKTKLRTCALRSCGIRFKPVKSWQKYHSSACRNRAFDKKNPRVRVSKLRELQQLIKAEKL